MNQMTNMEDLSKFKKIEVLDAYLCTLSKYVGLHPTILLISPIDNVIEACLKYFDGRVRIIVLSNAITSSSCKNVEVLKYNYPSSSIRRKTAYNGDNLDIIIDSSGSHHCQIFNLNNLFHKLNLGGTYIVEGLGRSIRHGRPNFLSYTKSLVDIMHQRKYRDRIDTCCDINRDLFSKSISSITFYDSLVVLTLKDDQSKAKSIDILSEELDEEKIVESVSDLLTSNVVVEEKKKKKNKLASLLRIRKK